MRDGLGASAFTPNGKTVVSGGFDKKVRFWRLDQPEPQPKQKATARSDGTAANGSGGAGRRRRAGASPFSRRPDVGRGPVRHQGNATSSRVIEILNVANRQIVARVKGHLGAVCALAYSPDGKTLASGAKDRSIRLWDVKAGTTLRDTWLGPWPPGPVNDRIMTNLDSVEALAISPDGKTIVTTIGDPIVTYWQVSTHEVQKRLRDPSGPVRALAISPDGSTLATGGDGRVVKLWELSHRPGAGHTEGSRRRDQLRGIFARWQNAGFGEP